MGKKSRVSSDQTSLPPDPTPVMLRSEIRALQSELSQAQSVINQLRDDLDMVRHEARGAKDAKDTAARLTEELERRQATMEYQREVAREFQSRFLPPALPTFDGVRFAVKYLPCERVGGDFYDVFDMGNDCVGLLIADISGFGLAATLATAVAKMAFDTFRQNEYSPKVIIEKVNGQLAKATLGNQFVTAFLGVLDLGSLRLKYVNASHPSPVLCGKDRFEVLDAEGLCCGMFEESQCEEREVTLKPGDRILLYTRGLFSAPNAEGKLYESSRLHQFVRDRREASIEELVQGVGEDFLRHIGGQEQHDDVILVALDVLKRESKEERIIIRSDPQQLRRVESVILPRLEALNYGERAVFGVRLAIEEAVVNAMKHGNHMDKAKKVSITYSVDANECRISVEDEGEGFDPSAVPNPTTDENLELPHGRGLMLIHAYMDEVSHNEKGNCIMMCKRVPWADEQAAE